MTISEYDAYINTIDVAEDAITDDTKFPVIKDNKIKKCCRMSLELMKVLITYIRCNIKNGAEKKKEH